MDWLICNKDLFETLSYIVVLIGIPIGVYQYIGAIKKEQQDREYGTYNALDEKYIDFQRLCFDHPELDIFDIPDSNPNSLNQQQHKQQLIAFTMLFSIFERAFLMYHDQSTDIKARQWVGWEVYIKGYCKRTNFKKAWEVSGATFDTDFEQYMFERFK